METVHLKPVKLSEILPTLAVLDKAFLTEDPAAAVECSMGPLSLADKTGVNDGAPLIMDVVGSPGARVTVIGQAGGFVWDRIT